MNTWQRLTDKYSTPRTCQSLVGDCVEAEKFFLSPSRGKGEKELVNELYRLLRGTPVYVVNMPWEFGLDRQSVAWRFKNQEQAFRIADLVFGPLFSWLHHHRARQITADNILDGMET